MCLNFGGSNQIQLKSHQQNRVTICNYRLKSTSYQLSSFKLKIWGHSNLGWKPPIFDIFTKITVLLNTVMSNFRMPNKRWQKMCFSFQIWGWNIHWLPSWSLWSERDLVLNQSGPRWKTCWSWPKLWILYRRLSKTCWFTEKRDW